ncbi:MULTISPECIES: hypothetical protein [unclassified Haematobacter]|uniref:hypothetical protein n=1 Tax=unclassified Haematobacter TaxID=2640585 RepID=UPI0025C64EC5|nr:MULTISPECIES: hypothetical protein [unclassified Haematobacter]
MKKHHVALFGGNIIGQATSRERAIRIASPNGKPHNVDFYDAEDGPGVKGYEPDGKGVWIIDPA